MSPIDAVQVHRRKDDAWWRKVHGVKHAPGLTGAREGKLIWRKVLPLLIDGLQGQPGFCA